MWEVPRQVVGSNFWNLVNPCFFVGWFQAANIEASVCWWQEISEYIQKLAIDHLIFTTQK